MCSTEIIIKGCKKRKYKYQKKLYNLYAPNFRGICMRYANNYSDAEDILQDSFIKIFNKIDKFESKGSFEGWLKRIVINTSINYIQKKKTLKLNFEEDIWDLSEDNEENEHNLIDSIIEKGFTKEKLINIIMKLPENYRLVYNLYNFEDFSHQDIAIELEININTSKSLLRRSKQKLKELIINEFALGDE